MTRSHGDRGERTIVFLDLARFTTLTDVHGNDMAVDVLDQFMTCVHDSLNDQATVVKTLGDGVLLEAPECSERLGRGITHHRALP